MMKSVGKITSEVFVLIVLGSLLGLALIGFKNIKTIITWGSLILFIAYCIYHISIAIKEFPGASFLLFLPLCLAGIFWALKHIPYAMKYVWLILAIVGLLNSKWYWDWYKQGEYLRDINCPPALSTPLGHIVNWAVILLGVFAIYKLV